MEVTTAVDQRKEAFLEGLTRAGRHPLAGPALVAAARQVLLDHPVPTTRTEAWKYTRVGRVLNLDLQKSTESPTIQPYLLPLSDPSAAKIVLVNGQFRADMSILPKAENIRVQALSDALATGLANPKHGIGSLQPIEKDWFAALNMGHASAGIYIHVPKGQIIESPIYVLNLTAGRATASVVRHIIDIEDQASVNVIFHSASTAGCSGFHSSVLEAHVGQNASLSIDKVQDEQGEVYQHATEWVAQARDSRFDIRTLTLRGHWLRNNLNILSQGENTATNLFGTYMPAGTEHIDNQTMIDHQVPHCTSNETYKGFLNGRSTGVFNGKVFVRQDAQKTNAYQQNSNILLSNTATMNAKPELEIYADDVKCSHGSTTGQLDEEALFYLRARGLNQRSARQLLVEAFVGEIIEQISDEALRTYCLAALHERAGA